MNEVRKRLFECIDRVLSCEETLKTDIQLDSYDQAIGDLKAVLRLILEN